MNRLIVAFVAGAFVGIRAPALPGIDVLLATLPVALGLLLAPKTRWLALVWFGFAYAATFGLLGLAERLPPALVGEDLRLEGRIVSLPERSGPLTRFRFRLGECEECWAPTTVMLSVYGDGFQPAPGERWQLTARLSRPRGSVNPGLFDYDGWLLAEGIGARGYVRREPPPVRLSRARWLDWPQAFRSDLRRKIAEVVPNPAIGGLMTALTIGDSAAIGRENWRVLSDTGTNHLLIISGLHVGLVAGAAFSVGRRIIGRRGIAGFLALLAAAGYGVIAGMGLPVQRALIMTAVGLAGIVLNRRVPPTSLFCLALIAVVMLNPFAMLSAGFWLSFGAVFSLLYAFGALVPIRHASINARAIELVRSQWVVFAGTTPLLLALVFQVSLVAMVANLVAIPWVGLLVIPPLLLAVVCLPISEAVSTLCLLLASESIEWIWTMMTWLAELDWVILAGAIGPTRLMLALLGSALLLAPGHPLPKWPAVILWLPLVTPSDVSPAPGEMIIRIMDVGQGLAVLVRTHDHALLYDAGPRYGSRFDAGEQIVLPTVRRLGHSRRLDTFIISHMDNDHAGGADAVLEAFLISRRYANERVNETVLPCDRKRTWRDGRTVVEVLPVSYTGSDNDRSCVTWVTNGNFTVLLPGDIETIGERRLIDVDLPPVDLLVVPHHGSRTSSTPAFLNHVRPALAVVSAGFGNRFGHPDPAVLDRYRVRDIPVVNTANAGAVTVRLQPGEPARVERARSTHRRFWYD
ncbi:MAG: DNA internalization-related competence protein ComEC/Rec2 [Gammaproteobacteria bacterium]|nr:DNA internalization-related competence protein ComEC/Rec2 [Gammaproteobacteria bacterium]